MGHRSREEDRQRTGLAAGRAIDRYVAGLGVALAIGLPILLWLGRGMTFFADEWAFIESRSLGDPATWLPPHNEHASLLPVLGYRLLVETVGLTSYVPYQAVVVGLHGIVVALVFALVRSAAGGAVALAISVVILAFGSGFENLYWGFQTGFVGAMAAGLGALLAAQRGTARSRALASILLLASLMTAGIGLVFAVALAAESLARGQVRRMLLPLGLPIALFAVWYLTLGRTGTRVALAPQLAVDVPRSIVEGLANAAGGLTGLGPTLGIAPAAAILALALARLIRERSLPARVVGPLAGIVALYSLIGLARASNFEGIVEYTRYTYESGILLAIALPALLQPWRDRWIAGPVAVRERVLLAALGGSLVAVSLTFNIRLLLEGRALFLERAALTRALVTVALERPVPATTDPERTLVLVPSPASLERIVAAYGSPLGDRIVPSAVEPIPPDVLAEARGRLAQGVDPPR
jgi:hypothetical protein